jgi:hypothetical protein
MNSFNEGIRRAAEFMMQRRDEILAKGENGPTTWMMARIYAAEAASIMKLMQD